MKTARLIVTYECKRQCPHCCNKYAKIMRQVQHVRDVNALRGFDIVCITGGEPMLDPVRTTAIIKDIRSKCPDALVYLYTALVTSELLGILDLVDGMHFTLHEGATAADVGEFGWLQSRLLGKRGSYRLYLHPTIKHLVSLRCSQWSRIEVKPWLTEEELLAMNPGSGGLPPGETLFSLDGRGT